MATNNSCRSFFAPAKCPARVAHMDDKLASVHVEYETLHADTEPDLIARRQCRDIAQAWQDGLREPAAISDRTDLPLCNVLRWLVILRLIPRTSIKTEWWHYDPQVRTRYPKRSGRIAQSSKRHNP